MYCAGHLLEAAIAHNDYVKATSRLNSSGTYTPRGDSEAELLRPLIKYINHINQIFGPKENQRHG